MKSFVSIGPQTHEVEVDGNRGTVDGVGLETDLVAVSGTPLYHLLLAGASWTVAAEPLEGAGRWTLGLVGERVEVAVADERSRGVGAARGQRKRAGGGGTGRAPTSGRGGGDEGAEGERGGWGGGVAGGAGLENEDEGRA